MYDPAEMMEIFAICVALAGIAYLRQLFASMRRSAPLKPPLEYSIYGDLTLPTDFYEWVYVQLTDEPVRNPVDLGIVMNYPDAYVDPAAYKHFLSTQTLPDGTIAFKRSAGNSPITSTGLADRSCRLCSVSSDIECANVAVKDSLQFGENLGWGFFRLNQNQNQNQAELDDLWRKL
jgi:hypothetical protein